MGADIGTVEGTLRLRDLFNPPLNESRENLEKWGKQVEKMGKRMTNVGAKLSVGLTAPLLAAGAAATKFSVDMNRSMANVATLIPGNTQRVQDLKKEVQDLAIETGKSTADLSEGLYQTVSAFGDAADSAEKLRINAKAAVGGVASTLESIDLTSAVTKAYGDTSAEAVRKVSDLALSAVRLGQTTFPELAESIVRVTSLSESMGQSQEDLFAVFATATGVTGNAARVSTQYMGVLNALMKPTAELSGLIEEQGFASGEAMLRQLGLVDTLELISTTATNSGKPITEYIAQIEAVPLALALAGPQADVFRTKLDELGRSAGSVETAFREQSEGINRAGFELQQAMARMQVAWQKLGDVAAPIMADFLAPIAKVIESLASAFGNLPPPMQAVTIALAGIAAATGPVLVVVGQMTVAWSTFALAFPAQAAKVALAAKGMWAALTGPVGLVFAALTAATALAGLAINTWANNSVEDIKRIADASRDAREDVQQTVDALNSQNRAAVESQAAVIKARLVAERTLLDEIRGGLQAAQQDLDELVERARMGGNSQMASRMLSGGTKEMHRLTKEMEAQEHQVARLESELAKLEVTAATLPETVADGSEEVNNATNAFARLESGVSDLKRQLKIMEDFGVSAEVAASALRMLLDPDTPKNTSVGQVVALAKEMDALRGEIQDVEDARQALIDAEEEQIKVEKELLRVSGELYEQARDAARDLEDMVAEMEHEAQIAAELAEIRADLLLNDEAYNEIVRQYNTEQEIANTLKQARNLMEAQYAAIMADVNIGEAERLRKLGDLAAGYEEYARRVRAAAEAEDGAERGQEAASKAAEKWREEQDKLLDLAYRQADTWRDVGRVIAGVFDDLGSDLGDLIVGLGDAAAAWRRYAAAKRAGDTAGMEAAQADAYGSLWSAAGSYLGGALAGGGISTFGGELGGTYSQEGAEVGSYFGPVWGAVGAVLGGFIDKAGDEARVSLENFGAQITAGVDFAEGGLGDAANALASGMNDFIRTVEGQLGISLPDTGGLSFQFLDTGVLEVRIAGLVNGFRDLGEAMGWAAEQLLRINAETADVGDNVRALLSSLGRDGGIAESMEELQAALALAQEADRGAMGEQLAAMQAITAQRQIDLELALKYGLAYEDVLAVTDRRIAQLREEVEAMRAGLFGTRDFASQALEVVRAMEAFNAGIEAETTSRQRALDAARDLASGLDEVGQEAQDALDIIHGGGGGGASGPFHRSAEGMGRAARAAGDLASGAGGAAGAMGGMADALRGSLDGATGMTEAFEGAKKARFEERRELWGQIADQDRARESADALARSLGEIPEAFSAQDIVDVWTKAASDAGLALISMIRQVRGEEFGAAQERQLMTDIFRLQLAVQLQAVYQLLAAAETLRDSTRAILTDLAAQAEQILGDPNLRIRRGRGPSQRQQEEERAAEQMAQDVERLNDMLTRSAEQGMSEWARGVAEISRRWDEAVPLAHGNEDALRRIAEARERETEALREQIREGLLGRTEDFVDDAPGQSQLGRQVADIEEDRVALIQDLYEGLQENLIDFSEFVEQTGRILAAEAARLDRLVQESMAGLSGALAEIITDEDLRARLVAEVERINFIIRMEQLRAEYEALLGLGRLTAAQADLLEDAFAWIDENWDDLLAGFEGSAESTGRAIQGSISATATSVDSLESSLRSVRDLIDSWTDSGEGPFTARAREMQRDLEEAKKTLGELRLSSRVREEADKLMQELGPAFAAGVEALVDDALSPFEDSGLSELEQEYQDLLTTFSDIAQAFRELGLGAEDMERLATAQQQAMAAFWADATSGLQGLIDRLTGVESGRAPLDLLAEQQAEVEDLFARVMSGDLSALEGLDQEAEDLLDLIDGVFGSGRAGGMMRDQLLGMLKQVVGLDPSAIELGGGLTEPYELKASDIIAEPFDLASYLSSGSDPGSSDKGFESALEKNRNEMQKYDRERERERKNLQMQMAQQEFDQRATLIRVVRDLDRAPLKDSSQVGA